jgi:anti-sigma factor ChrR (cupin superfamily)
VVDAASLGILLNDVAELPVPTTTAQRLRETLFSRIANREKMHVIAANAGEWFAALPGIRIKPLFCDSQSNAQAAIWALDRGAKLPAHGHHQAEECIVLQGRISQDGKQYGVGDFLLAPVGLAHSEFTAEESSLLYLRGELREEMRPLFRAAGML